MASNDTERSSGDVGLRLTYAEIAERLGISGDAARQLVRRRGWLRIVPNRRGATTTVIVPEGEFAGEQWRDTRPPNDGDTTPDGNRPELRMALTLVDRLSVQLAEANARADVALQRAAAAEARADRAEADKVDERQQADTQRAQIDELKAELLMAAGVQRDLDAARERLGATSDELSLARAAIDQAQAEDRKAHSEAEALRKAEAARKARGLVARLRAAWRGE